ncbi:MAG: FtsQ-type POTRA domain-containing protein [Patescibacteria group bacterium]|nr:FtsQ-type POTRA domain-containing protein [Patescibacteria group bacterium]
MMAGKSSPYLARRAKKFKCVKKDYQHKNLHNPFFHKQSEKKNTGKKNAQHRFWLFPVVFLFLAVLLYLLFFSGIFALKQIKVSGVSRIAETQLSDAAWQQAQLRRSAVFKQNNLLFFNIEALRDTLLNDFSFDSVRVYRQWPHTLIISVGERGLSFIWRDSQGTSFSDSRGCLIKEASVSDDNLKNYPLLTAAGAQEYLGKDNCLSLDDAYLQAVFTLYEKLKDLPGLDLQEFVLDGAFNTLQIKLNGGPNIFFNIKDDLDKQLKKLAVIKQEKGDEYFKGLEYIDLRYGDRAYFK